MRSDVFSHIINGPKAPKRLQGLEVKAILTEKSLGFLVDLPDDATAQEIGYFRWFVGEMTDIIMDKLGLEKSILLNKTERGYLTEEEKLALEKANDTGYN